MIFLLLSIISSTLIGVTFKLLPKFNIDTFQAIVFNYWVCVIIGGLMLGKIPIDANTFAQPWFPYAIIMGIMFISGFYAVGMTVTFFGITIASILQRMSLLISVPFAILVFSEAAPLSKIIGLSLALSAVVLSNWKDKKGGIVKIDEPQRARHLYIQSGGKMLLLLFFPIYGFLVSGAIEVILQHVEANTFNPEKQDADAYSVAVFAMAGTIGTIIAIYLWLKGRMSFGIRHVLGGLALGIPNYFSIVFLLLAFGYFDKSVAIPVSNIAIVAVSALLGFFVFAERLSIINWLGVAMAAVAIGLISMG